MGTCFLRWKQELVNHCLLDDCKKLAFVKQASLRVIGWLRQLTDDATSFACYFKRYIWAPIALLQNKYISKSFPEVNNIGQ